VEPISSAERDRTSRVERAEAAGVPAAAALLAISVLLSRLLGFARESLLAYRVGASAEADAYYAAFQLPDMLNYLLVGGALSAAFLPYLARVRERSEQEGDRFFATVLGNLGLIAVLASAGLWLAAEPLVALQFPDFSPAKQELTTRLTKIVVPAQIFFVVGGVVQAPLLARGRFAAAALAPLVYNLGILVGGFLLAPWLGVEGFSWGALAGAVLGPFGMPWLDARRRVRLGVRVALTDRDFLRYLRIAAPLMLGLSLLTIDEWYNKWFGGRIDDGAIALLVFARRLMQAPVAVVGQAIGQAVLPALANLWAAGRHEELDRVVSRTLRAAVALGILAAAGAGFLAEPLVRFVYERGAFTPDAAARTSTLLALFSLAVPAWVAQQIATRAFYARGDTWRPMLLGTAIALLAIPLYLALGDRYGVDGLAAAGVGAMSFNALVTLLYARRLHGGPALLPVATSALRALAIAIVAGLAARAVVADRAGTLGSLLDLACGGAVFAALAAAGVAAFGDESLRATGRRIVRRLARRPAAG